MSGATTYCSGAVTLVKSVDDNYSVGKTLTDPDVIIQNHINANDFGAYDANGIYLILTANDVTVSSGPNYGFCTAYCGFHSYYYWSNSGNMYKYSWVGDASTQCPYSCGVQTTSPNGDFGADNMISVIAHELAETVSDPLLNAWFDSGGDENADKCAWNFGTTYTTSNGAKANVNIASKDYLIQQNWLGVGYQNCALSYP